MIPLTNKSTLIDFLKVQIATRDHQAIKALITVYNNQTDSEQSSETTKVHNGVGFTPIDAEFMTSLAKQYLEKKSLSKKQLIYVKKTMPKYASQLIEQAIANGKITKVDGSYTWVNMKVEKPVQQSTQQTLWSEANERRWMQYKNEFAKLEAEQEAQAFMAKMRFEQQLNNF